MLISSAGFGSEQDCAAHEQKNPKTDAALDQHLAAVSRRWNPRALAFQPPRRRGAEVARVEPELRRYALRRLALLHDRPLLHADADGEPWPRLHRMGQGCEHPI